MKTILGIDLSITSPACCVFTGEEFSFDQCKFFFLTSNKKLDFTLKPMYGKLMKEYNNDQERYHNITSWVFDVIDQFEPSHIFIEGYSFNSTGKVFNIAENTGILKYNLWKNKISFTTIPPTVVKKHATGRGNSNKAAMELYFLKETNFDIRKHLCLSKSSLNPITDIIDSYYVTKAGLQYEI